MTLEQKARVSIDTQLQQVGWHVCSIADANIHASRGVALREFPLNTGYGFADYLLYIDGKTAGVIEAKVKQEGTTLTGVEMQSARYALGLFSWMLKRIFNGLKSCGTWSWQLRVAFS